MVIGGLQKFSLSDFPQKISAIIFTRGCNLRCSYCHNPELVDPARYTPPLDEQAVLEFLHSRIGQLQGVVITGGEPTIHADLPRLCRAIRCLGYSIKLDTNGTNPSQLKGMMAEGLIDYLALDVKAPASGYQRVAGGLDRVVEAVEASIQLALGSGLPHELRTTYADWLLADEELEDLGRMVRGCTRLVLQRFVPTKALDPEVLRMRAPSVEEVERAARLIRQMGVPVTVR